jgi:predicted AAA+ superfamily ATPase
VRDGLQVHFYRDYADPGNRRSPVEEVDFVAEAIDGSVIPIEVKFRSRIDLEDWTGMRTFMARFKPPFGLIVTRDISRWDATERVLFVPLLEFLLAL